MNGETKRRRFAFALAAPPCDEPGHVVAGDVGDQLVLAEELDQQPQAPHVVPARPMLPVLGPITSGDVVEPQRCRAPDLLNLRLGLLAFGRLYFFGFPLGRGLGRAVKAMTSELEVVLIVWRALVGEDGHAGTSLRV